MQYKYFDDKSIDATANAVPVAEQAVEPSRHNAVNHREEGDAFVAKVKIEWLEDGIDIGADRNPYEFLQFTFDNDVVDAEAI